MSTASFSVEVLPETFTKTKSGNVIGAIHINADGFAFPDNSWDDFVVRILGWWLEEVSKLCFETDENCSCYFMDGPFRYDIEARNNALWQIRFIDDRGSETCVLENVFEPRIIVSAILSAAGKVVQTCHERGWASDDLDTLAAHYSKLSQLHTKQT